MQEKYHEFQIMHYGMQEKYHAPSFARLNNAKDKQRVKSGRSRVRRLPRAGKPITNAW